MRYLESPNSQFYMLSKNMENRVRMTFGFSLYAVLLQVAFVTYCRRELREL